MIDLKNLMDIDGAIPFSAYMKNQKKNKQQKKTRKQSRSPSRKRRQKRNNKRTKKKAIRVPPKGVIIRKKDKLYRSNGKSLQLL